MKDKILENLIKKEIKRQNETLDLIPSENFVSNDILKILGSPLTNKYAEGYSALRYYGGNEYIDQIENLCKERALKVFGLSAENWHVNVQPYSGSTANLAALLALVPLGEKIMGLELNMGGHLTHGHKVSATGKIWQSIFYGVNSKTELLDYEEILNLAKKERPKIIITGYTAYPRLIDFKKFREIADSVHAYLMADISHVAGLVAGGVFPSPFEYADVVTTTTQKTLRGPRAAIIYANKRSKTALKNGIDIVKVVDKSIFPGLQGGPHENQIAAVAAALYEASTANFKKYARQIVLNAKVLAEELKNFGFRLVSGGTDTHLLLIDLTPFKIGGKEASELLEKNGLIVNKNTIPYDKKPPIAPSGIRLGTPALTTRGMKEKEMKIIAKMIFEILVKGKNLSSEVKRLCRKFPLNYKF